jgi:hypothetical protein
LKLRSEHEMMSSQLHALRSHFHSARIWRDDYLWWIIPNTWENFFNLILIFLITFKFIFLPFGVNRIQFYREWWWFQWMDHIKALQLLLCGIFQCPQKFAEGQIIWGHFFAFLELISRENFNF